MLKTFVSKLVFVVVLCSSTFSIHCMLGLDEDTHRIPEFSSEFASADIIIQRARARMIEIFGHKIFHTSFLEFARAFETYLADPTHERNIWDIVTHQFFNCFVTGVVFPEFRSCTSLEFVALLPLFIEQVLGYTAIVSFELINGFLPVGLMGENILVWRNLCHAIVVRSCEAAIIRILVRMGMNTICVTPSPSQALATDTLNITDSWVGFFSHRFPAKFVEGCSLLLINYGPRSVFNDIQSSRRSCPICGEGFLNTELALPAFYTSSGSITSGAFGTISTLPGPLPVESALIDVCHIGCILAH